MIGSSFGNTKKPSFNLWIIDIKALRKAEYSEFRIFEKFETCNIPYMLYIRNKLRQNRTEKFSRKFNKINHETHKWGQFWGQKCVHLEVKLIKKRAFKILKKFKMSVLVKKHTF